MIARDLVHILEEYGLDKEVKIWLPDQPEQEQRGPLEVPVKGVHIETIDPDEEPGQKFIELGHTVYLVPDFDYDLMKTYQGQDPEKNLWTPPSKMVRVVTMGRRDVFGGDKPMESFIPNSVEGFQSAIGGGNFELMHIHADKYHFQMFMDEDGRSKKLPVTMYIDGREILGPIFFSKTDSEGNAVSLTDEEVTFIKLMLSSGEI